MEKKLHPEFINNISRRCPYCGAYEPILDVHEDLEDGTWAFTFNCSDCGEDFDEIYTKIWVYDHYFSFPNKAVKVSE